VILTSNADLGRIDSHPRRIGRLLIARLLLPLGGTLAAIGYYGPWIQHPTAALTVSGVDMAEFVKFLPDVLDGSLRITRQILYLPPFALVIGVALLIGSQRLGYPWQLRLLVTILAVPISLQLLPPAWSPASLMTAEFRLQAIGLGLCWLLLAGFWLLGRMPLRLSAALACTLALAAGAFSAWGLWKTKPSIDQVYGIVPSAGWGFTLCQAGLGLMAAVCLGLVLQRLRRNRTPWSTE
jgi:hypothetical protein